MMPFSQSWANTFKQGVLFILICGRYFLVALFPDFFDSIIK